MSAQNSHDNNNEHYTLSNLKIELKNNLTKLEYKKQNKIFFYELINKKKLHTIINNPNISQLKKPIELKKQLQYILKKINNNNLLQVKYTRNTKLGRIYAFKAHSYQNINKTIRNTLAHDKYTDIDMVNAHPSILNEICRLNKLDHKYLNYYVNNRDKELKRIMKNNNTSYKYAKKTFNVIINGGNYKNIFNQDDYLDNLTNEIKSIKKIILDTNPKIIKEAEKNNKKNIYDSAFSYFLQEKEHHILEIIYNELKKHGIIDDRMIATLCFDGIMVLKNDKITQPFLDNITTTIENITKFKNIKLQIKDMSEHFMSFENKTIEIPDRDKIYFNIKLMSKLSTYKEKKKYFELFYCKILNPIQYISINKIYDVKSKQYNNNFIFMKKEDLKESICEIGSGEIDDGGNEILFYDMWHKDTNKRCYNNIDFIPYNPTEKFKVDKEIFNLFKGYNNIITTPYAKSKTKQILAPYLDLLYELCGAEQNTFDYTIKLFAKIIQSPRDKPCICLEIRGEQGCGKNISTIPLGLIIGEDHFISSPNPDDFFSTHAIGFLQKLIVIMDEMEISKTYKYEAQIKSAITEEKRNYNVKHAKQFSTYSNFTIFSFTNKGNGLKIDFTSSERRFMITRSTNKYLKKPKHFWKRLYNYFHNPQFISCLYDYFMSIDTSNIDWIKDRPITKEYLKSLKQYIPSEALYLINTLNTDKDMIEQDDNDINIITLSFTGFYTNYITYCNDYRLTYNRHETSIKAFERKMVDFGKEYKCITIEDNQEGERFITIYVDNTLDYLKIKNYLTTELEEYQQLQAKYNLIEENTNYDDYFIL